jgi:hypothetical protein
MWWEWLVYLGVVASFGPIAAIAIVMGIEWATIRRRPRA